MGVAFTQDPRGYPFAADARTVAAAQVDELAAIRRAHHLRMMSGHKAVGQDDVVVAASPQSDDALRQSVFGLRRAVDNDRQLAEGLHAERLLSISGPWR